MLTNIISICASYLIGSLSSAIIVCKIFRLPDPRSQGSNNPGATNVMRIGGKIPAILTLLGDSLKGLIPVSEEHYGRKAGENLLDDIQANIYNKALNFRDKNTRTADSYDEFKKIIENEGGFVEAHGLCR